MQPRLTEQMRLPRRFDQLGTSQSQVGGLAHHLPMDVLRPRDESPCSGGLHAPPIHTITLSDSPTNLTFGGETLARIECTRHVFARRARSRVDRYRRSAGARASERIVKRRSWCARAPKSDRRSPQPSVTAGTPRWSGRRRSSLQRRVGTGRCNAIGAVNRVAVCQPRPCGATSFTTAAPRTGHESHGVRLARRRAP
jgi:hypothetical protein